MDQAAIAARALALACLYQAAGAMFFLALFESQLRSALRPVRRLCALAALAAAVLALLQPPLAAARMAGDFAGALDVGLLRLAWLSHAGAALLGQLLGLALLGIALCAPRRVSTTGLVGAVLAAAAPVLAGHSSVHPQRAWLAPLLVLHLLCGAFWFGALWPLWLALRLEAAAQAAALLQHFSAIAAWVVPCIALAGVAMAGLLLRRLAGLERPYGVLLLAKTALFALLMGLAALNRWRFTPALERGAASALPALQHSILAESALIGLVLAVTATLTTLYSPED